MWCLSSMCTNSPSLKRATQGELGGNGAKCFLASATASVSKPAKTVVKYHANIVNGDNTEVVYNADGSVKINAKVAGGTDTTAAVTTTTTDANGKIKPQLAKSSNDCSINLHDKPRFVSRKLDGVRCLISKFGSSSRGGGDYDIVTTNIRKYLEKSGLFEDYPDLILDGELYVHG